MPVADTGASGAEWGVALLVSAGLAAEMIAKACSSPQTAEINADKRAGTLMKWVNVGCAEAAVFIVIAAAIDKRHRVPILLGGFGEIGITYWEYLHAKKSGLANPGPGTEDTPQASEAVNRLGW
jgi:hypothetical protein